MFDPIKKPSGLEPGETTLTEQGIGHDSKDQAILGNQELSPALENGSEKKKEDEPGILLEKVQAEASNAVSTEAKKVLGANTQDKVGDEKTHKSIGEMVDQIRKRVGECYRFSDNQLNVKNLNQLHALIEEGRLTAIDFSRKKEKTAGGV